MEPGEEPLKSAPREAGAPSDAEERDVADLSPEEQMERFEDALKEEDWGHQPC